MANKISFRFIYKRIIILSIVIFLSVIISSIPNRSQASSDGIPMLVRIEIRDRYDIEKLAGSLQIYSQLYTPQGTAYLIASVDKYLFHTITEQGHEVRILDSDSRGATYHLLYGEPEELLSIGRVIKTLEVEGRQAIINLPVNEISLLSDYDVMVTPLRLRPLVVPLEETESTFPTAITPDPLIQEMVNKVDQDRLFHNVGSLSGEWEVLINDTPYEILTRYTFTDTPIKKATRYAYEKFIGIGLITGYDTYSSYGEQKRNVIAEQTGSSQPDRIFMLIAHLDSTSPIPYDFAPGADDNASGSSAILHIAEILSQYKFGCTLRYALFTGEEQGNLGSEDYANDVRQAGENIEAVINLDMLAYNSSGTSPTIELHTRPSNQGDLSIANIFAEIISTYAIELDPKIMKDGKSFSDHAAFWEQGYPAILAIEDWADHTPHYHKTSDQLETLNMFYYTEFAKAAIATFAHIGCIQKGELSGTVTDADTGEPIAGAYVEAILEDGRSWWTNTQPDGTYQLTLMPAKYTIFVAATQFYSERYENIEIINEQHILQNFSLSPGNILIPNYLPLLARSTKL